MSSTIPGRLCADDPHALAEVERAIASGALTLLFTDELEQRFQADTLAQRRKFLNLVGISGMVVYNFWLLSDWLSLNDVFIYLVAGRLCLFTPLNIGLLVLSQRVSSRWALEVAAASGTVLSSVVPMVVMVYSNSPYRLNYQMGMLLIMVFCTMIQQIPTRLAALAMACMLIIMLVTTYLADLGEFKLWQVNALLFVATALLLMLASYFLERGSRLSYLFALRGQLLEVQLRSSARTDALTQLFNRRYQAQVMASVWEANGSATQVAVIMLDIDHFKAYNDNYGHLQGDSCLALVSQAIQRITDDAGVLAFRFGGEEILVLALGSQADQAQALAESLRVAVISLAIPHPILGNDTRVTVSVGIATGLTPQVSAATMIAAATVPRTRPNAPVATACAAAEPSERQE